MITVIGAVYKFFTMKLSNLFFLFLPFVLITLSCKKDNSVQSCTTCIDCKEGDGISAPKCVWKQNLSQELVTSAKPLMYKDLLITSKRRTGDTEFIQFFNKNTGEKLGEWSDYGGGDAPNTIDRQYTMYIYDNILVVSTGTRVYGVDLATFKTLWTSRSSTTFGNSQVYGLFDKFYHSTYGATEEILNIYEGSTKTGKYRKIKTLTCPDTAKLVLSDLISFVQGSDTFALLTHSYYFYPSNTNKSYFTLLNITQNKTVYERDISTDYISKQLGGLWADPVIRKGIMYYSGFDANYAFDMMTGKLVWRTALTKHASCPMVGGDPAIGDDFLYVSTEDGFVRCYDPANGNELWKTEVPVSIDPLLYDNGFLFFRGAASKIKVLDTKAKKIKWDYKLNATIKDDNRFPLIFIVPDPATGRFYTTDFKDIYCFDKPQR